MIDSLTRRFFRLLTANWVIILLATGIAWILSYSLSQAQWVIGDTLVANSILWGFLFGCLLSRSRFRGPFCAAYSISISILITGILMARLAPAIWQGIAAHLPLPVWLNTLNLRLWTWLYRISAWMRAITTHTAVGDTGFFVFLLSLILWNLTTWFVWSMIRTYRIYPAILLTGTVLAVNIQLSGQGIWQLWFFLFLAILLVIRTEYRKNHSQWDRQGLDYPDDGGFDWSSVGLGLTILITSAAMIGSIVGTREGLKMLRDVVTVSREKTADTAEQLFSGVTPPRFEVPALFAQTPDLQNFNSTLPQGKDVIMWVKISDPPPPPPEAQSQALTRPPQRYWRAKIYTNYTKTGWKLLPPPAEEPSPPDQPLPANREVLKQEYEIQAKNDQWLFASNNPVQVDAGGRLIRDFDTDTSLLTGRSNHYLVTSWVPKVEAVSLERASQDYNAEIRRLYLQLPAGLPARITGLTRQITTGASTPLQKALRIQSYLRSNYTYNLITPPVDLGKDFVDTFLFETQTGYCSHFASAMVVMLRIEGVPARVAAGYSMGTYDYNRQAYRVVKDGAHAWVEVYFTDAGWVEFEPTPSQNPFQYGEGSVEAEQALPALAPVEAPSVRQISPIVTGFAAFLFVAAIAVTVMITRNRMIDGGAAGRLYWTVRGALRQAGVASSPTTTPDEFLLNCETAFGVEVELQQVTRAVTGLYERALFSAVYPAASEIRAEQYHWGRLQGRYLAYLVTHRVKLARDFLSGRLERLK